MAFDGIITKAISSELQLLKGSRIDKIFQPDSNTIILGMYLNGNNYALNICTNPKYYRIHLTTHPKSNPKVAPNFCMVLRKHLIGLRIKNIITNSLERLVIIELEGFDDIDDIISSKLIVELMGKHCNVILLNDEGIIVDSLRHINNENSTHIVVPHIKYTYPHISKISFLDISDFTEFKNIIGDTELTHIPEKISNTFNGISKNLVSFIISNLSLNNLEDLFYCLKNIINKTDSFELTFKELSNDYFLLPTNNSYSNFYLNFKIDDFYYSKESKEELQVTKNNVLKLILLTLKKYKKRLQNIGQKLNDCTNMDNYKLFGELITSNLYRIPNKNVTEITVENYYDNNNLLSIPLDNRYSPSYNAKRFFKKYHKLKNALEVVSIQKEKTIHEINYIESVVYELESANSISEIAEILQEISENEIFQEQTKSLFKPQKSKIKKSNLSKNKTVSFNPLKYNINGFTLLVGRNNKENDYLSLKYANKSDIWFHTKDIHGSHAILILNNKTPNEEILLKCAEITAYHSKARLSSNVPVDTCEVKFVKKPKGAKPGMVIYTNYTTLYVNPKNIK